MDSLFGLKSFGLQEKTKIEIKWNANPFNYTECNNTKEAMTRINIIF
jgi:hypothetical protein